MSFTNTFRHRPLAAILNSTMFCVHGGISPNLGLVEELCHLAKPVNIAKDGKMAHLLWSDPQDGLLEWGRGREGLAHHLGLVALAKLLSQNRIRFLLRSHQPCDGY
jgi:diadenosine tetraphosphatase ApaH/serine/threonine PP2A family protein phosphatase